MHCTWIQEIQVKLGNSYYTKDPDMYTKICRRMYTVHIPTTCLLKSEDRDYKMLRN